MRRVTLPTIGAGTDADPFRPDLPTFVTVATDRANGTITVLIPDTDVPPIPAFGGPPRTPDIIADVDPARLLVAELHRWHDWLDARYADSPLRFRPMPRTPAVVRATAEPTDG